MSDQSIDLLPEERRLVREDSGDEDRFFLITLTESGKPKLFATDNEEDFVTLVHSAIEFCSELHSWSRIFAFKGQRVDISDKQIFRDVNIGLRKHTMKLVGDGGDSLD